MGKNKIWGMTRQLILPIIAMCTGGILLLGTPGDSYTREIKIVLTFDDGPHAAEPEENHTLHVVRVLQCNHTQNGIVGAFFIQTHAGRMGKRRYHPGNIAVKAAYDAGNVIGIHTGSEADHASHSKRVLEEPTDVNADGIADGQNGLESDIIRASSRILNVTGEEPIYIRPVAGVMNQNVEQSYAKMAVRCILWNVNSRDNGSDRPKPDAVKAALSKKIAERIVDGERNLVVIFHDINPKTASSLDDYIKIISDTVKMMDYVPHFTSSRSEVIQVLDAEEARLKHLLGYDSEVTPP